MAPFPRADSEPSPTHNNRGRDIGIILAALAGITICIFVLGRFCGAHNVCRERKRRRAERRQQQHHRPRHPQDDPSQPQQQQHMNPARVMQICAQRDARMKGREKNVMTALEVELMAPLGSQHHPTTTASSSKGHDPEKPAAGDDAERSRRDSGSDDDSNDDTPRETGDAGVMRPHRSYRPPSGHEEELVCCVCLEGFDNGELVRATRCSHIFHGHCLERWLMRYHSRCPLCQQDLKPSTKVFE